MTVKKGNATLLWWLPAALFFAGGFGIYRLAQVDGVFTERYLSQGLYPVVMGAISTLTSPFPFAVVEVFLVGLPFLLLFAVVKLVGRCRRYPERRGSILLRGAGVVAGVLSGLYFVFVITCGVNYHRLPFTAHSGLTVRDSSAEELYALCLELMEETNAARLAMEEDENGVVRLHTQDPYALAKRSQAVFEDLGERYPVLGIGGRYCQPKPVFFSEVMSQANFLGSFSSYTGEPCINVVAPPQNIPAAMCHEQAHQRGFMREDEANFIAYLACVGTQDPDFRYSGLTTALVYCGNALYGADEELFWLVREQYSEGLVRDLTYEAQYWQKRQGVVAQAAEGWNDVYLKANSQEDGVRSYGRMVDLLLAEYRARHGIA